MISLPNPLAEGGGLAIYWGFDTQSVTMWYTETVAVVKMSSEVIKCSTLGVASFSQSP